MPDPTVSRLRNGDRTAQALAARGIFRLTEAEQGLPTAGPEWHGALRVVPAVSGASHDELYWCRLKSDGSYDWLQVA